MSFNFVTLKTPSGGVAIDKRKVLFATETDNNTCQVQFVNGHTVALNISVHAAAAMLDLRNFFTDPPWRAWNDQLVNAYVAADNATEVHFASGVKVRVETKFDEFMWGRRRVEAERQGTPFDEQPPEGTTRYPDGTLIE